MPNLSISLSDPELLDLKASACAAGLSVSEYIRTLLNPKVSKVKKCIREQRGLGKSLMMSVSCLKKEAYEYEDKVYQYIYDVNHVFIMDETLYPIYQGHSFSGARGTVGMQSILYAILCTLPMNSAISNTLWQDLTICFEPLMSMVERNNSLQIVLNNFAFERMCSPTLNLYSYYLINRD